MSLLPLDQQDLGHHQCGDEDEHHLGVHGLMTPVLHVQPLMLHSAGTREVVREKGGRGREKRICQNKNLQ